MLIGGAIVWVVFNVTKLEDRIDNEMNSLPAPTTIITTDHELVHPLSRVIV
jgi:hypothetical protein